MLDVLYVEDNPDDADVFGRVIRKMEKGISYKVINVGSEALDYLTAEGKYGQQTAPLPKLLLLDLDLSEYSGFEIIQRARSLARTRLLPIVVFSTSDNPQDISQSLALGANAYVVKPGSYQSINQMLRRLCDFWLIDNNIVT
ncbi:response regulator [Larkinella arboricola]|uniref:Response regulator receiver domain-containing protein n=1 Tax=Larkinella arboricola TaxID=643671 RepID=A0A327XDB4_LARAB|nr:response regulator [Larkinella arboricola]RAK02256.1 response regulator receiver domain-containing protein [Larkinella arboricola]